jgi:hypothetical protein
VVVLLDDGEVTTVIVDGMLAQELGEVEWPEPASPGRVLPQRMRGGWRPAVRPGDHHQHAGHRRAGGGV